MASLLRRSTRLPLSSTIFARRCPAFFCSFMSSSSPSLPILQKVPNQSVTNSAAFLSPRLASTKVGADENLEKVLLSEIECAQENDVHGKEIDVPEGFPFEVIDNPGDQTIILKREFAGENIQATVYVDFIGEDMKEDDECDGEVDDQESTVVPNITLLVIIDKGVSRGLVIGCNIGSAGLEIESLTMTNNHDSDGHGAYQGPKFSELDESLQKAFHKYLEVRGIKSSLRDFLHEYMMNKDEKEYTTWLKNVKEFVRQ